MLLRPVVPRLTGLAGRTIKSLKDGAADWNRTSDLVLTKDALYRLSYSSARPATNGALDAIEVRGKQVG